MCPSSDPGLSGQGASGRGTELRQAPLYTSLMGVVLGAAEYHGITHPDWLFFGGTGHAFLLNADRSLSRSSIHNWSRLAFDALLENLGLIHAELGHFGPDMTFQERNRLETGVRSLISAGVPCSVMTLEHQMIRGFDERGFLLHTPPPLEDELLPDRLDFGSWEQVSGIGPVSFHSFRAAGQAPLGEVYRKSLTAVIESRSGTCGQPWQGCVQGNRVFDRWISCAARPRGSRPPGAPLALVFSECRRMAGRFLRESASLWPRAGREAARAAEACELASLGYKGLLEPVPPERMQGALREIKREERECLREVEKLLRAFGP